LTTIAQETQATKREIQILDLLIDLAQTKLVIPHQELAVDHSQVIEDIALGLHLEVVHLALALQIIDLKSETILQKVHSIEVDFHETIIEMVEDSIQIDLYENSEEVEWIIKI
jgi:hypothetical protein